LSHHNAVFSQRWKLIPRHEFETLAKRQLSGRSSLRDIVESLSTQAHRLYHLGSAKLSRSNLSRINDGKPYELYEALFGKLLTRCQGVAPGHHFQFKTPLYSLDASTIDLCLSVFPWADFRITKKGVNSIVKKEKGSIQKSDTPGVRTDQMGEYFDAVYYPMRGKYGDWHGFNDMFLMLWAYTRYSNSCMKAFSALLCGHAFFRSNAYSHVILSGFCVSVLQLFACNND